DRTDVPDRRGLRHRAPRDCRARWVRSRRARRVAVRLGCVGVAEGPQGRIADGPARAGARRSRAREQRTRGRRAEIRRIRSSIDAPRSNLSYFIEYTERAAGFETLVQAGHEPALKYAFLHGDLRAYHLVTAVDYLQANRERLRIMDAYARATRDVDVVICGQV